MIMVNARPERKAIPWLVHLALLAALLVALCASLVLFVRPASAQSVQAQQNQQVVVQNRWQFNHGWNDGYRDTVKACIIGKHHQLRAAAVQRAHLSDYEKGYLAGVDAAMKFARVCRR